MKQYLQRNHVATFSKLARERLHVSRGKAASYIDVSRGKAASYIEEKQLQRPPLLRGPLGLLRASCGGGLRFLFTFPTHSLPEPCAVWGDVRLWAAPTLVTATVGMRFD